MLPCVVEDMAKVFTIGITQYNEYKTTRFITGEEDVINTKITKNLLKLPKDADKHIVVNPVKVLLCAVCNTHKTQECCDTSSTISI